MEFYRNFVSAIDDNGLRREHGEAVANGRDSIGTRIAAIIDATGLTQAEFGRLVGVGADTVNRWVNNRRRPSRSNIALIARLADVPAGAMLAHIRSGEPLPKSPGKNGGPSAYVQRALPSHAPAGMIPLVNRVSAGKRREMTDQGYPENWAGDWIERGVPHDARAFLIDGDSMSPELRSGDIVIAAPSLDAQPGMIVLAQLGARHNHENCVRKLLHSPSGMTILAPLNQLYETRVFSRDEDEIDYLWPVVEIRRKVLVGQSVETR